MEAREQLKNRIAQMSTAQIVETFDAMLHKDREPEQEWQSRSIVRGALMDELEMRDAEAFFDWLGGNDASPAAYFLADR
jgi:hypothetical protein